MKTCLPRFVRPIAAFAAFVMVALLVAACTVMPGDTPTPATPEATYSAAPPARATQAPSPSPSATPTPSRTPRPTAEAGISCYSGSAAQMYGTVAQNVELVGHFGGAPSAVAVRDGYAYLEAGAGLLIVNVVDPDRPVLVGRAPIQGNLDANLTLLGQYAYTQAYGVCILDVTDPQAPKIAGFLDLPDFVSDMAIQDRTAYLANERNLRILDVSDPLHPAELGVYAIPERGYAAGVTVAGNYAYVVDRHRNVYVVDVRDPGQPRGRGSLLAHDFQPMVESSYHRGIVAANDLVYLAIPGFGLSVIDASDPDRPFETGALPLEYSHSEIALSGHHAYLDGYQGLYVVDLAEPRRPVLAGTLALKGNQNVMAAAPDFVYAASDSGELQVIDVHDPARPAPRGVFLFPALIYELAVQLATDANYVYVNDTGRLHIIDVSDSARPVEAGQYQALSGPVVNASPHRLGSVSAQAGRAYAIVDGLALQVIDVADPAHPQLLGECRHMAGRDAVVIISGRYVYLAGGGGLSIVDIADPHAPRVAGTYPRGDFAAVAGRYAYVSTVNGIEIVDVSDPAHPAQTGTYPLSGRVQGLAIVGRTLYVSEANPESRSAGLRILDLADPARPVEIGTYAFVMPSYLMRAAGHTLYLGGVWDVQMLDVRDPAHPVATGQYATTSLFRLAGIAVAEPYVYALGAMGGLHVLYFDPDTATPLPTPTPTPDPRTPRPPPRTMTAPVVTANPAR